MNEMLSLDPKARPSIDRLLYWGSQLKAAHIEPPRYLSPCLQRGKDSGSKGGAPLRELQSNNIPNNVQNQAPVVYSTMNNQQQAENRFVPLHYQNS